MVKIAVYPPNSLVLADLLERKGHTPLVLQKQIRQKIKDPEIDSPPMNITEDDPIQGLKYAAIEVPSGVRGRMAIIGPLIDEAEAAIVVDGAPYGFGCIGCARTNELSIFLLRNKGIPVLELNYPTNQDETYAMVNQINDFEGTELNFRAEAKWKADAFTTLIEDAFDKRYFVSFNSSYHQSIDTPTEEAFKHDLLFDIWDALTDDSKHGELHLKGSFKLGTILHRMFDDWYNVHYIVTSENDDTISQMSPGKKALVLLELLINLKESNSPILIDQPEDDLDNRSIYTELSKFIKEKKVKRQIIVVTHNANIVLGADAEQVIVANQNGKDTPNNDGLKFEYRSGALEENDKELNDDGSERIGILSKKGIQTQICDILEGGRMAFELRKNKYSVNRNT